MTAYKNAALHFVDFHSRDFLAEFAQYLGEVPRRVLIAGENDAAETIGHRLKNRFGTGVELIRNAGPDAAGDSDIQVLAEDDPDRLSALLHGFIDRPAVLFAPRTERYLCGSGLFIVTIPKSGTHLLLHLLSEFRLYGGGEFRRTPAPHTWYFPSGEDPHLPATQFFGDLWKRPLGGYDHPLFRTPVLFMYRSPLDILVSDAAYLAKEGNNALNHYFRTLDESRRLDELISSPLLGEFWQRIVAFAPWLDFPNVIPVCFEELVGPKGGGSLEAQARTVWSLQLKLHVPGAPVYFSEAAFYTGTLTFNNGQTGNHKLQLRPHHLQKLAAFPQDFMQRFGYDINDECGPGYLPRHVDLFRRRPLRLGTNDFGAGELPRRENAPDDRIYAYRGYLVAKHDDRYYGVPRRLAPLDPQLGHTASHVHTAYSLEELLAHLEADALDAAEELTPVKDGRPEHVLDFSLPQLMRRLQRLQYRATLKLL